MDIPGAKRNRQSSAMPNNSQTCDVCKLRHQKCDGERPTCSHCELRNLKCVYSNVPAHHVDRSVIKERDHHTEDRSKKQRVSETFSSHPTSSEDVSLPDAATSNPLSPLKGDPKPDKRSTRAKDPQCTRTAGVQYLVDMARRAVMTKSTTDDNYTYALSSGHPIHFSKRKHFPRTGILAPDASLPSKTTSESLLEIFLESLNKLIYVCDPMKAWAMLNNLYDARSSLRHHERSLLLLQLSLGALFTDDATEENTMELFSQGLRSMDIALIDDQGNWLWTAQANLLICLFEATTNPGKGYLTLGSAIRVAQTYRLDFSYKEWSNPPHETYSQWRQVWLSMIYVDSMSESDCSCQDGYNNVENASRCA
ncbi:hypothetical protein EJ04DRAFT_526099 [Polyplosphaeria fusca]|uniref:Zn(2)-C6 fungal-type domain-containing protein n=1 Tax=Polyplosphaeria fusca TaxID=682080 RepID=A0A9P4QTY7_9PLEO|nr:hypothetical protein EJ04DRAFT_526099 [Polyplosphaeria fusca]